MNNQFQGDLTSYGLSEAADGASQEGSWSKNSASAVDAGAQVTALNGRGSGVRAPFPQNGQNVVIASMDRIRALLPWGTLDSIVARRGQTAPLPPDDLFCNARFWGAL